MQLLDADTAKKRGFYPLAGTYSESEEWMMYNVLQDMWRGRTPVALVKNDEGVEVWRSTIGARLENLE